jgi:hypothetical protein
LAVLGGIYITLQILQLLVGCAGAHIGHEKHGQKKAKEYLSNHWKFS